jgi:hypothetical protein
MCVKLLINVPFVIVTTEELHLEKMEDTCAEMSGKQGTKETSGGRAADRDLQSCRMRLTFSDVNSLHKLRGQTVNSC